MRRVGRSHSLKLGYSEEELAVAPEGANLGLGCGNPQAIADLKPGEVVVDLGAGAGFDCFLAARAVGTEGLVVGVDMTPEMVARARYNARKAGYENVDFRLGEIEHLPVGDQTADVIISNCVINLSPDKPAVYGEAFRVLRPGGRLAISDVVATAELPPEWRDNMRLLSACISGASTVDEMGEMLRTAGFVDISINPKDRSREFIQHWEPGRKLEDYVLSADIRATKPKQVKQGRPTDSQGSPRRPMDTLSDTFKALSDKTRLQILTLLVENEELCVCDLVGTLGETQSKVSRHLRYLYHAGLVKDRREGLWTHYRLSPDLEPEQAIIIAALSDATEGEEKHELREAAVRWFAKKTVPGPVWAKSPRIG